MPSPKETLALLTEFANLLEEFGDSWPILEVRALSASEWDERPEMSPEQTPGDRRRSAYVVARWIDAQFGGGQLNNEHDLLAPQELGDGSWVVRNFQRGGNVGKPSSVVDLFTNLRYVPASKAKHVKIVEAGVHDLHPEVTRADVTIGAMAVADDIDDFEVFPSSILPLAAGEYLIVPKYPIHIDVGSDNPFGRRHSPAEASYKKVEDVRALRGTTHTNIPDIDIVVLPESVARELESDGGGDAIVIAHPSPNRLRWILAGTGPREVKEAIHHNRAVLMCAVCGESLIEQDKASPFNITTDIIKRWGLEHAFDLKPDHRATVFDERIEPAKEFQILESRVGRFAIAICEDLGRLQSIFEHLAPFGPTHIFVPVFDAELTNDRWATHRAQLASLQLGAEVVVVNCTAIARNPLRPENRNPEPVEPGPRTTPARGLGEPVGASLLAPGRGFDRREWEWPRLSRSRRPGDVMVPNWAPWGDELQWSDLELGDIMLFLRLPPNPPADLEDKEEVDHFAVSVLSWLIALKDDCQFAHAAFWAGMSPEGTPLVIDSYAKVKQRTLKELISGYGLDQKQSPARRNPIIVMRHAEGPHVGSRALSYARRLANLGVAYPGEDLPLGLITASAPPHLKTQLACGLDKAFPKSEIPFVSDVAFAEASKMCAALVATAFAGAGFPLDVDPVKSFRRRNDVRDRFGRLRLAHTEDPLSTAGMTALTLWLAKYSMTSTVLVAVLSKMGGSDVSDTGIAASVFLTLLNKDPDWEKLAVDFAKPTTYPLRLVTSSQLANSPSLEPVGYLDPWAKLNETS